MSGKRLPMGHKSPRGQKIAGYRARAELARKHGLAGRRQVIDSDGSVGRTPANTGGDGARHYERRFSERVNWSPTS